MSSSSKAVAVPEISSEMVNEFLAMNEAAEAAKSKKTKENQLRDSVTALLGVLGAMTVQDDALTFEGEKFILPGQYEGNVKSAIDFLVNYEKQQSQTFEFNRTFPYRRYDGAHAFMTVMKQLTGTAGFGVTIQTMFGPIQPSFVDIETSYGVTEQVPQGTVAFPMYNAEFQVGAARTEQGICFHLSVEAPRRYRAHIKAIFDIIEAHLAKYSIYRGKAINGGEDPTYIDTSLVSAEDVVYSADVLAQLRAHVWTPIKYSDNMRRQNLSLNRKVLFAGPYGTGKTLGAMLTAQEAVENGWTFVICRTGKDNPADVLRTAELYAPCVVVIEDIDVHAEGSNNVEISQLLEMLDGIVNKGKEIVALFTTNHLDRIQKGALRPGRIDAVIEIGELDEAGFRQLIRRTLGTEWLADDIDWEAVAYAFREFLPAFVKEAASRAQRFAMSENQGYPNIIVTADLVHGADSLRPQLDMMNGAKEGARPLTINDVIRGVVDDSLGRTHMHSHDFSFHVDEPTLLNGALNK